jgi:hypothetical protein
MMLASSGIQQLGVDDAIAALRFGSGPVPEGASHGNRLLWLGSQAAFELTFWCGTCPVLFQRLHGANGTLSVAELEGRLGQGISGTDSDVLAAFGALLPSGAYLPLLLSVTPQLVMPSAEGDYFAHEQVATWGINAFWGLPENPRTPYYRTFQTRAGSSHLYEFVVPMVPPSWNDRARVQQYTEQLAASSAPTAVAVSILDIAQPAVTNCSDDDYYQHWALIHFLLDGHHKLEAAATAGRPLRLLSLISADASLASRADILRLPAIRSQKAADRRSSRRAGEPN